MSAVISAKQASLPEHILLPGRYERTGHGKGARIWCGREGWMTLEKLKEVMEEGIERYARKEPLKYRQAMRYRSGGRKEAITTFIVQQNEAKNQTVNETEMEAEAS